MRFTSEESNIIQKCIEDMRYKFLLSLINTFKAEFNGIVPQQILKLDLELSNIENEVRSNFFSTFSDDGGFEDIGFEIDDTLCPLLLRCILYHRKLIADNLVIPLQKTDNPYIVEELNSPIKSIDSILKKDGFEKFEPLQLPVLSDFFTSEWIESKDIAHTLKPRVYDEKFHILIAPLLFVSDLQYFREKCYQRGSGLSVAYLDIDDFKSVNSQSSESEVDRHILPKFMRLLEKHIYFHGYAYRFGGDEYTIILPNISESLSETFFNDLRQKISELHFENYKLTITASIGVYYVNKDCTLTENEILAKANLAKNDAKKSGKNKVKVSK